ncbi:4-hydroxythreonine-4-phosphate dehydrogenase [Rubidibacter lacunae KORDI 51-2]|uniref:4-hydroxythreonine-4-phosphate dehydrogenase n=1 Tax=Rubidibacter lacunae KORDI 51-2 TaxID=582515 RepID=U5DTF2_9CHRO|nr:4-hydroxythreonine-4-phosphate dehydrogenase PdxA [Rubidibacter lacunae]ERN42960.1 4-hydroxythreonine-4-phosphate dehydrogenase [Rubidibacter lacunae KORDI 51-2]
MTSGTSILTEPIATVTRSRLALPLGDPAGIGPEVVLKTLADPAATALGELTVIGSRKVLIAAYQQLRDRGLTAIADPNDIDIIDVPVTGEFAPGEGNAASGAASFTWLQAAIAATLAGRCDGVVTAPIAKSLWAAAGRVYPGQTEVLAEAAGVEKFGMLFAGRSPHSGWMLRTLLATTHIPLRRVPDVLTPELLAWKLDLLVTCLHQDFAIDRPTIAVSGLNPHSGEGGQLGTEERDWLIPLLERERRDRPHVQLIGPVPPDTLWMQPAQAWYGTLGSGARSRAADAYLALYHDQGLIPVKLLAFDCAANITIGLPFVRTSPDHGTAFDIAGRGIADPTSFKAAVRIATELVNQRRQTADALAL